MDNDADENEERGKFNVDESEMLDGVGDEEMLKEEYLYIVDKLEKACGTLEEIGDFEKEETL